MPTYTIKNWTRFQHYKHRHPPWIRLHCEILTSADWVMLDDASRLLAVVCMLIASKHDGQIPASCSPAYFKRIAYLDEMPNFKPLIESGFLVETLAPASVSKRLRTNADTETESDTDKTLAHHDAQKSNGHDQFVLFWQAYPKKKAKRTAEKAYLRAAKLTPHEKIMEGLQQAKKTDKRFRETEFTPYPATWLNGGSWEDEPDKPKDPFHQDWRDSLR